MIFKHEVERACTSVDHERMAAYLHQEFERLIDTTPELTRQHAFGPVGWSMSDRDRTCEDKASNPEALFREFESHNITPAHLARMHFVWVPDTDASRFDIYLHYTFGEKVQLQVEGPNRIVVDGIGAAFERIAKNMEAGTTPKVRSQMAKAAAEEGSSVAVSPAPLAQATPAGRKKNWLARTWHQHTVSAVVGLVVTVVGAGIAAFFGFN